MVNLLRRREMVQAASAPSEWDFEWDATKGLLSLNGWTESAVGSGGTVAISGDYMKFTTNSSNYRNYSYPDAYTKGVVEAEILTVSNAYFRLNVCGNDVYSFGIRLQTSTNYNGIFLGTSTSGTRLMTVTASTKYKIKLVLNEGIGQMYVNDVLITDNIDTTAVPNCSHAFVSGRGTGNTNRESRLYSLKMKLGRI